MVKYQDILILTRAASYKMSFDRQQERAKKYYTNNSTAVLVRQFILDRKGYFDRIDEIKAFMKLGNFRLVVCHKNLLSNAKALTLLFRQAKSIYGIDKDIPRSWLEKRATILNKKKPSQGPKKSKAITDDGIPLDVFGLPIINGRNFGIIDHVERRVALRKERKQKKINIKRGLEREARKVMLQKKRETYQGGVFKDFFDIVSWYAPIDQILTRRSVWLRAVEFYKKTPRVSSVLFIAERKERAIVYNITTVPESALPEFKKIIKSDKTYLYDTKRKRSYSKA